MRPYAKWLVNHRMKWVLWVIWATSLPFAMCLYCIFGAVLGFLESALEVPDLIISDFQRMKDRR